MTLQRGVFFPRHWTYPTFRESFYYLISHQDLYAHCTAQGYDRFKYSPAFALLFAPFALPPFALGLLLWNLCNVFALYLALNALLSRREAGLAGLLLLPEVLAATQASQSDTLVAALIIFAFIASERDRPLGTAASIGAGTAIKLFPLAGLSFAPFPSAPLARGAARADDDRCAGRATAGRALAARAGGAISSVGAHHSRGWTYARELGDGPPRRGHPRRMAPNWPIQLLGALLLLVPLVVRRDRWHERHFRLLFLCSLLVYAVIFNHRSERSSFVIAAAGIRIAGFASTASSARCAAAGRHAWA